MNRLYQSVACLLLAAMCSLQGALAQLPDGSIAPDFTATDINGVQHNLYDLLDDGKKVILEFTATWCGPCWNHHQTGVLSQLYEAYGPDGTDELRVFLLESDDSTNSLDLDGNGPNTMGDWVSNTPFPIIDDAQWIFSLYNGSYYPTIFSICPDGTLTEAGQQSFEGHIANFATNGCPLALPLNEVALLGMNHPQIFCPGAPQTITVQIQNQGLDNLTSANLSVSVDEQELQSLSWNGNLPTFGITEVVFDQIYFAESTNFSVEINSPNDESLSNNTLIGYIEHSSDESGLLIHVEIMVDAWPQEIAWAITDESGDVVEEIGSIGGGGGDVFDWWVTLPAEGCYIFEIFDSYGDGIIDGYCTVTSWWDDDNLASTIYDYDGSYWYQSDRASFSAASQEYPGCLDESACNYDQGATIPDPSACTYPGCQDPSANNYDPGAGCEGECNYLAFDCSSLGEEGWSNEGMGLFPEWHAAMHGMEWFGEWVLNIPATIIEPSSGVSFAIHHMNWMGVEGLPDWVENVAYELGELDASSQHCISAFGTPSEPGIHEVTATGEVYISIFGQPFSIGEQSFSAWLDVEENPSPIPGCTYATAQNFLAFATLDDGSCEFAGCTDHEADNFNPLATIDDGSCGEGCDSASDASCQADNDGDGLISVSDLLILLGEFGSVCE